MFCAVYREHPCVSEVSSTLVVGVTREFQKETFKFHDISCHSGQKRMEDSLDPQILAWAGTSS